ncbi:MAG: hypothetical protein Q7S58_20080 [Candidatus Binatus sp.]|uniref:hypothetical protein n=1 Tax=Candidatus Binatus sp. TaxID=2811406 RepID=UPI002727566D|nr:hypothetical protein [Candidatus Binatus sp.]MDO8434702.1 hypothetical protein [Candidatus Binatus sp.]
MIDLAVDPDVTDPRKTTLVLSHPNNPTGAAFDNDDNLVLVVSGSSSGFIDIIDISVDPPVLTADSPIPMPVGMAPGFTGQVLYDPIGKKAIINTLDDGAGCTQPNGCTGFVAFDVPTRVFGQFISANYAETFAFNSATNQVWDASDSDPGNQINMPDFSLANTAACVLTDPNLAGDHDGASVDFTTNIGVISQENGSATVVNLNGSTVDTVAVPCAINEGGTPPNSAVVSGLPGSTAGSAVNPVTHQAFLIEDGSPGITLLTLPTAPVVQLDPTTLVTSIGAIPPNPFGGTFRTQGDPYAVAIDVCHNKGYAVDSSSTWLVQTDLPTLQTTPASIATALLAGQCTGTTSTTSCKNGAGIIYFALPPVP